MKKVSQALINSEYALPSLFNATTEGIWVINQEHQTASVNRILCELLLEPESELINKSIFDYLNSADQQLLKTRLSQAQSDLFELSVQRIDGQVLQCLCRTALILDQQQNPVGTFVLLNDISKRKKAEADLQESRLRMEQLSIFQQQALEMERKRIARELHDELGQSMTALHFDLKWLTENISNQNQDVTDKLQSMKRLVSRTVDSVRRISEDLRPGMLDDLGLAAAIEHQVSKFSSQTKIDCELFVGDSEFDTLNEQVATALFRIVQESLTNVARHSGATQVTIRLQELKDNILLIIQDNGSGLPSKPDPNKKTYGLLGMRERVNVLKGTLDIFNETGAGARIEVCVPK